MAAQPPREWKNSGAACCTPFSSFCLMFWCPCMTYGKTHHRLRHDGNMAGHSNCNGACWGYCALAFCGFQWALQMMHRGEIRSTYNLEGNGCKDCLCACCCTPCDLMQQDKEVAYREQEKQGLLVAPTGYTSPASMTYPSPGSEKSPGVGGLDSTVAGSSVQSPQQHPVHSPPPNYNNGHQDHQQYGGQQMPQNYQQQQQPQQPQYYQQPPVPNPY